jgi:DNA-binding response OmpR family regulator
VIVRVGTLEIDEQRGSASLGGRVVPLRPLDLRVLTELARTPHRALTREAIAHALWGPDAKVDVRSVDSSVTRIRRALDSSSGAIVTVRRVGYRLDPLRLGATTTT